MKITEKNLLVSLLLITFMFLGTASFVFAKLDLPSTNLPSTSPVNLLTNVINWAATIVALVAVLIIIIAGIMWATAGGNDERQTTARKMLISAIVGLVIVGAAYGIVYLVTSSTIFS